MSRRDPGVESFPQLELRIVVIYLSTGHVSFPFAE